MRRQDLLNSVEQFLSKADKDTRKNAIGYLLEICDNDILELFLDYIRCVS